MSKISSFPDVGDPEKVSKVALTVLPVNVHDTEFTIYTEVHEIGDAGNVSLGNEISITSLG